MATDIEFEDAVKICDIDDYFQSVLPDWRYEL